jgi:hypothetical protein
MPFQLTVTPPPATTLLGVSLNVTPVHAVTVKVLVVARSAVEASA